MSSIEDRRYDRTTLRKTKGKLTSSDGTAVDCEILNVSHGGAAIQAKPKPAIGETVTLGLTQGRVIRHGESSISIEFAQIQDAATLHRQFGRFFSIEFAFFSPEFPTPYMSRSACVFLDLRPRGEVNAASSNIAGVRIFPRIRRNFRRPTVRRRSIRKS
jgi:hypothetical protein